MRIFVSSRMKPILDRKSAIDAVHLAEHRPLYIETERYIDPEDPKKGPPERREAALKLRTIMESMIKRADAFVGLYHEDSGRGAEALNGQAPIVFELNQFLDRLRTADLLHEADKRVLLFLSKASKTDWINGILAARNMPQEPTMIDYDEYDDLISKVFDHVRILSSTTREDPFDGGEFTIDLEYHGADQAGLLRGISEYLFTEHGMNIDHVWGSSKGRSAMINLSASWVGQGAERPERAELEETLRTRVAELLRIADPRHVPLNVHEGEDGRDEIAYGYVEARSIDAPGQLNTICKAMTELDLNIDQIHLAPAPLEFPRQTVIALKVPLGGKDGNLSRRARFLRLESKLRDLVGVRAIVTRFSQPLTGA